MTDETEILRYVIERAVIDRFRRADGFKPDDGAKDVAEDVINSLKRLNVSAVRMHATTRGED